MITLVLGAERERSKVGIWGENINDCLRRKKIDGAWPVLYEKYVYIIR